MTNTTSSPTPSSPAVPTGADPRPELRRALAVAGAALTSVRPEELHRPTPCGAMDVQALIGHLVAVVDRIEVVGRLGDVASVPDAVHITLDELPARWADGTARALDAWSGDDALDRTVQVPWDTLSGRSAVGIYVNELTVHTWDLARATGREPRWDPEVLAVADEAVHEQLPLAERSPIWAAAAEALGEAFDPPFLDAVPVPADARAIDALVAWNGRQP